ncbi:MAG: hypothetical protein JNN05_07005 [Candidatus Omnitrophica bacterium]|nr:hypothetical protein [Candidatus Omnitrophota bacterium]
MKSTIAGLLTGLMIMSSTMAFAQTVYATKNGKKYHQAECSLISKKNPVAISMEEATSRNLTPCSKCFKQAETGETKNK